MTDHGPSPERLRFSIVLLLEFLSDAPSPSACTIDLGANTADDNIGDDEGEPDALGKPLTSLYEGPEACPLAIRKGPASLRDGQTIHLGAC